MAMISSSCEKKVKKMAFAQRWRSRYCYSTKKAYQKSRRWQYNNLFDTHSTNGDVNDKYVYVLTGVLTYPNTNTILLIKSISSLSTLKSNNYKKRNIRIRKRKTKRMTTMMTAMMMMMMMTLKQQQQ